MHRVRCLRRPLLRNAGTGAAIGRPGGTAARSRSGAAIGRTGDTTPDQAAYSRHRTD
jgi:hypothetical protein